MSNIKYRDKLTSKGKCINHPRRKRERGRKFCKFCLEYFKIRGKRNKKNNRKLDKCENHPKINVAQGHTVCELCLNNMRERAYRRYKFAKNNPEICPDLDSQINQIWENTNINSNFYIDCRRVSFITKCVLEKVKNMSYVDFMKLINKI